MKPQVSFRTIKAIARIICGDQVVGSDEALSPYRTHALLKEFFLEDLALTRPDAVTGTSRESWTEAWLKAMNGTNNFRVIVEASVRPGDYVSSAFDVANAVAHLNEFLAHDKLRLISSGGRYVLASSAGVELPRPVGAVDVLSDAYIQELAAKCDARLSSNDLEGAITTARTVLEAVLVELEGRLASTRSDFKGDLPKQFKHVAKLMRLDDERPDLDDRFKDVVRGLVHVVHGLAPLRNKLSDGHARERKPAPHHARVIVNASKTITTFLVESYEYQRAKGLLPSNGSKGTVKS